MSNATVKMIENYKESDPNFTLARQHEHHREEQEQMEKLRKVSLSNGQCHAKMLSLGYVDSEGADQPSLSAFRIKRALLFLLFLLFPSLFLCSFFSLLFSENTLLSLLFSQKMFEVTKNCNFFSSLASLARSF